MKDYERYRIEGDQGLVPSKCLICGVVTESDRPWCVCSNPRCQTRAAEINRETEAKAERWAREAEEGYNLVNNYARLCAGLPAAHVKIGK